MANWHELREKMSSIAHLQADAALKVARWKPRKVMPPMVVVIAVVFGGLGDLFGYTISRDGRDATCATAPVRGAP